MTVAAAVVMSLDAKLTRHDEPGVRNWASLEDQARFRKLIANHEVIIMGSHTYEAAREYLSLGMDVKRIVLTSRLQKFTNQSVPDRLEFLNQPSSQVITDLKKDGIKNVLVVGGPRIMTELLKHNLIDHFTITLEPYLFGEGVSLMQAIPLDCTLKLISCEQINERGTLVLQYAVIH